MRNRRKKLFLSALCFCVICAFGIIWNGICASAAGQTASNYFGDLPEAGSETETTESTESAEPELDMKKVTLKKTSVTGYLVPTYTYGKTVYYGAAEIDIPVNSPVVLDEKTQDLYLTCKSSSKYVRANATLSNNTLHLQVYADKKRSAKLTVSIAEKKFKIKVSLKTVKISANSLLLPKGKSKKLKISGCSKNIKWYSSNKKIATVSKKGVVKGKKIGNVVITAKVNGKPIGCAVSVTTDTLKRVCEKATYIGNHWTYSQALRTRPGYYDCSALVWKAYSECAGFTFGNANYPGTSATESAWCRDNGKMIKGGYTYKKVSKMLLRPGDLVFKSTNPDDPYHTTYHVEMFTGYTCYGYDTKGKPLVTSLWASRSAGYGAVDGSLLGRPLP